MPAEHMHHPISQVKTAKGIMKSATTLFGLDISLQASVKVLLK